MEKNQSTENVGKEESAFFFWIFIASLAVFVLLYATKYIWG